jgi:hypothetical protein
MRLFPWFGLEVFSSFMGGVFGCAFVCKWRFVPWFKPQRAKSFSPCADGFDLRSGVRINAGKQKVWPLLLNW